MSGTGPEWSGVVCDADIGRGDRPAESRLASAPTRLAITAYLVEGA
jgi:hypothetical protein